MLPSTHSWAASDIKSSPQNNETSDLQPLFVLLLSTIFVAFVHIYVYEYLYMASVYL